MDALSQYLALENGALTRKLEELEKANENLRHMVRVDEELLDQSERRMQRLENDLEEMTTKWDTMSAYARWLEPKVQGPIIGRSFPRASLRYVFERNTEQVTLIYRGQRWFTNDMIRWHPLIDLTTDEEMEGEEDDF